MDFFNNILNWFVPAKFKEDYDQLIKAKIVVGNGLIWGLTAGTVIGTILFVLGHTIGFYCVFISGCIIIITPFIMKYTGFIKLSAHIIVFSLGSAIIVWNYYQGGLNSYMNIWLSTLIILSILVLDIKVGLIWTAIITGIYIYFYFANDSLPVPFNLEPDKRMLLILFLSIGSAVVMLVLTYIFVIVQKDILMRLRKSQDELEMRIEERTKELQIEINERKQAVKELKRLEEIIDGTSDMVSMSYPDTSVFYMNNAGLKMLGWKDNEDISKRKIPDVHPEWAFQKVQKIGIPIALEDGLWTGESALIGPDGKEFPVSQVIIAHKSTDGKLMYLSTIMRDITNIKNAERDLLSAQNYTKNIINSMPSIIIGLDENGKVTHWNSAAEKSTNITAGDAEGKELSQVIPYLKDEIHKASTSLSSDDSMNKLKMERNVDGKIRFEDVIIYPLVAGGTEGAVIRIDDITERVHMEELMIQSEKMLSVGGLAAGMAHEINNPLAGILQNSSVLMSRLTSREIAANEKAAKEAGITLDGLNKFLKKRNILQMLDDIKKSGERAAKIVLNMLSFARKESSSYTLNSLSGLLNETIELVKSDYDLKKKYDFRHIQIIREYDPETPPVSCEASKIQQVFLNILKNGAEAMSEKEEKNYKPVFELKIFPVDNMVCVEIKDNGPGLDEATRKRVFEPFFTTKDIGEGTGLGMSVSYFIITENHNGEMTIESNQGDWTKFIIKLPVSMEEYNE